MRAPPPFLFALLVAATVGFLFSPAHGDGIKMLPPSDFGGDTCAGTKTGVLQWDGANPIRCVPGFAGDKDGNVGIGTTLPKKSLVNCVSRGTCWAMDNAKVLNIKATQDRAQIVAEGPFSEINLMADTNLPNSRIATLRNNEDVTAFIMHNDDGSAKLFSLAIDNVTGNVGIGTKPEAKLDVNGAFRVNTAGDISVTGGGNNTWGFYWGAPDDAANKVIGWDQDSKAMSINGNVGIGTTTPKARLDVGGEVRVGGSGTACSSANEGAIRYNSGAKAFEGCDGAAWKDLRSGGQYQVYLCSVDGVFNPATAGCRIPNPRTGKCSCPPGFTAHSINDFNASKPLNSCPQAYYENRGMAMWSCD